MGTVATTFRVMPDDIETDLKKLAESIRKAVKVQDMREEPMAFGMKALQVMVLSPDKDGHPVQAEEAIRKTKGVREVEVTEVTLI